MVKTIRALDRGLQVLDTLQEIAPASLEHLYRETGLPKATLLRILATLQARGLVRRGLSDGLYRSGAYLLKRFAATDSGMALADAAAPILDRLCRSIGWPSDITIPRKNYLQVVETSRAHSAITVSWDVMDNRVPMLSSAAGRAYLAWADEEERAAIIASLATSTDPVDVLARDPAALDRILAGTVARGYGVRDAAYGGRVYDDSPFFDDNLSAMAVPILGKRGSIASLNLVWIRKFANHEEMAAEHLQALKAAAAEIAEGFSG